MILVALIIIVSFILGAAGKWWIILGILLLIFLVIVLRSLWKTSHCPDCGEKLGSIKKNQNGWLYRECNNSECAISAIGLEFLYQQ